MVTTNAATSEIVPDADILSRAHIAGEPRLLKHLPDGDYTPNLLTILHSIPGAREALLLTDATRADYGEDADWWHGHPIPMPKIVHTVDGTAAQPDEDKYDEIIAEVQRLMAFLDSSDRSYATIGGLTQTDAIKNSTPGTTRAGTLLELFVDNWMTAAFSKSGTCGNLAARFMTSVGTNSNESLDTPELSIIDMHISPPQVQKTDLTELLDSLLWNTDPDDIDSADHFIERPADILILRLAPTSSSVTQVGVEIPAELYLDKYLKENITASRSTRREIAHSKRRILEIEAQEQQLMYHPHPKKSNERIDARQMLRHTLGHFNGQNRLEADNADEKITGPTAVSDLPPHYRDVAARLEEAIKRVDEQLERFAEEKERTRQAISDMSKASPLDMQEDNLEHRYTLRGVATKPNITYLLMPKTEPEDEEMLLEPSNIDDDSTPEGMQWWRIDYEVFGSSAKINKTKAPDYDVLRAAELEHSSALLVYANDQANDPDLYDTNLLRPLETFIARDNAHFQLELESERTKPPAYDFAEDSISGNENGKGGGAGPEAPLQSIEERASLDSTRAETGYSPPGERVTAMGDEADDGNFEGTDPPNHDWENDLEKHASFGLGYGPDFSQSPASHSPVKTREGSTPARTGSGPTTVRVQQEEVELDPPTVDIVLDDEDDAHPHGRQKADAKMGGYDSQLSDLKGSVDTPMGGAESQNR